MSVYHIGDLHIGHKKIIDFRDKPDGSKFESVDEHDEWIIKNWNNQVSKRDKVFVHGDVCFNRDKLCYLDRMNGLKVLIKGNHDLFQLKEYSKYFHDIHGIIKYKGHWLTHAPIHSDELRGCDNIHGHTHNANVAYESDYSYDESCYINVCVDKCDGIPVPFLDIEKGSYSGQ